MKLRDRIVELRRVPASELLPNPKNWRNHPEAQRNALRGVLSEIGIADAVLCRETPDGLQIIDGHCRAEIVGDVVMPVLVLDVDEDEADKLLVTLDPLAAMAEADAEKLEALLATVKTDSSDVQVMLNRLRGLDADGSELLDDEEDDAEAIEDEVPDAPEVPITQPGDLWILGDHRLVCGDSTKLDAVERLKGGKMADLVFTDPPYNVAYEGKTKKKLKIDNDSMSNDGFRKFLEDAFSSMAFASRPGSAIYICHADSEGLNFRAAMISSGWLCKQCLIWVKNSLVLGRQDYQWMHEPILYGWKPGAAHRWASDRKQTTVIDDGDRVVATEVDDGVVLSFSTGQSVMSIKVPSYEVIGDVSGEHQSVWRIKRPQRNADHPTMKPVAIPHRAVINSSRKGEIVLDLFGGSGSTMSACQQASRRAFLMELSPKYCDVIVARWELLTGNKATREPASTQGC